MKRILAATFSALLLTTGLLAGSAGQASAASACWNTSCNGHDPYVSPYAGSCGITSWTTGTYQWGAGVATLTNYFSSACDSNWIEATLNSAAINAHWQIHMEIDEMDTTRQYAIAGSCFPSDLSNSGQTWERFNNKLYGGATGWPAWTDMVAGQNWTQGTLWVFDSSGRWLGSAYANQ